MRGTRIPDQFPASNAAFRRVVDVGFLSDADLDVFHQLTRYRRSLPLYLGGFWRCYECKFESSNLVAMGTHIMRTHGPTIIRRLRRSSISLRGSS